MTRSSVKKPLLIVFGIPLVLGWWCVQLGALTALEMARRLVEGARHVR